MWKWWVLAGAVGYGVAEGAVGMLGLPWWTGLALAGFAGYAAVLIGRKRE